MDLKQLWIIIRHYLKAIVDSWFVIFTLGGVAVLAASGFVSNDPAVQKAMITVGTVIVASGGFSAFTRFLSVHGIVKKEMENILFGDEYLKTEQGFDVVWNKVVSNSVSTFLPSIGPYLHKEFLREYLPAKDELFYKEYHQTFDVYWHDEKRRIILIKEKSEIEVHCGNASAHDLKYGLTTSYPIGLNLGCRVLDLKIDGVCHLDKVIVDVTSANGIHNTKTHYTLSIAGAKSYRYFRRTERLVSLDFEPFIEVGSSWHTYQPRVTVNCHDDGIRAYFTSTGTTRNFDTIAGQNNSRYMEEQYAVLLLKSQGYTIYFSS